MGTSTTSQHSILDTEKLSQIVLVLRTEFEPLGSFDRESMQLSHPVIESSSSNTVVVVVVVVVVAAAIAAAAVIVAAAVAVVAAAVIVVVV